MTHSSGIPIAEELREAFAQARADEGTRAIKVEIVDEKMVPVTRIAKSKDNSSDFGGLAKQVAERDPCYLLFKLDESGGIDGNQQQWIFVAYAPDNSHIKARMLYASSRDTCKKSLGYSYFAHDYHCTFPDELSWSAFNSHQQGKYVDAPLTASEVEYASEKSAPIAVGTKSEGVHSVQFPLSAAASEKLSQLKNGSLTTVFLHVDPTKESIELLRTGTHDIASLSNDIPELQPCYIVFRYAHSFQGSSLSPIVFIYSCPENGGIKLKILHRS